MLHLTTAVQTTTAAQTNGSNNSRALCIMQLQLLALVVLLPAAPPTIVCRTAIRNYSNSSSSSSASNPCAIQSSLNNGSGAVPIAVKPPAAANADSTGSASSAGNTTAPATATGQVPRPNQAAHQTRTLLVAASHRTAAVDTLWCWRRVAKRHIHAEGRVICTALECSECRWAINENFHVWSGH